MYVCLFGAHVFSRRTILIHTFRSRFALTLCGNEWNVTPRMKGYFCNDFFESALQPGTQQQQCILKPVELIVWSLLNTWEEETDCYEV